MTNAHWGYWKNLVDDQGNRPVGSLSKKSKNLGDGGWCQYCLENNFYQWIELNHKGPCPHCKMEPVFVTNKDKL